LSKVRYLSFLINPNLQEEVPLQRLEIQKLKRDFLASNNKNEASPPKVLFLDPGIEASPLEVMVGKEASLPRGTFLRLNVFTRFFGNSLWKLTLETRFGNSLLKLAL
jgi:hypothetical protein